MGEANDGRLVGIDAADGLRLAARIFDSAEASVLAPARLPVVCLPGLSRNSRDFLALARALSADPETPRPVVAIDARGRGLSDRDPNPANYNVVREAEDALRVIDALGLRRAVLVGTSRGGILSQVIAATRPDLVAGVVLNDIGPAIETRGLIRIKGYVGGGPARASLADAAEAMRALHGTYFPALEEAGWLSFAAATHREDRGGYSADYDPALAETLSGLDPATGVPPAWELFAALAAVPVLVVRGALSDILTAETAAEMARRHPDLRLHTVPDEGHAPLLADAETIRAIAAFCRHCDGERI